MMVRFFLSMGLWMVGATSLLYGQQEQAPLLELLPITVTATRWHVAEKAPGTQEIDSTARIIFNVQDAGTWLQGSTGTLVKTYGLGRSASLSVRGGNAGHTAVQWNGFPLQHPMLGVVDLSLLPNLFADDMHLEHGVYGAGWGSGAVGGVLHLENQLAPGADHTGLQSQVALGSFSDYRAQSRVDLQRKSWGGTSRAFIHRATNDFSFETPSGGFKTLDHARVQSAGWMNGVARYGTRSRLNVYSWLQAADREIPAPVGQELSQANQQDKIFRNVVDYKTWSRAIQLNLRAAWFRERLNYEDPIFMYSSESLSNSRWLEASSSWRPGRGNTSLQAGVQQGFFKAVSGDYAETVLENRTAVFAGIDQPIAVLSGRLLLHLRREWNGGKTGPWVPSLQLLVREGRALQYFVRASRTYRWPTLNDRFWIYGGNPDLQPELGWGGELGLRWNQSADIWQWTAQLTGFTRDMSNWIQWTPGADQIWRPQNVQKVWSRGMESMIRLERSLTKNRLWVESRLDMVRATTTESAMVDDPALSRQLVYVPLFKNASQIGFSGKRWFIVYRHTWTARQFTVNDHSRALEPLHLGQVDVYWKTVKTWVPDFNISLQNVWNTRYQSVADWPMPGRNVSIQLRW